MFEKMLYCGNIILSSISALEVTFWISDRVTMIPNSHQENVWECASFVILPLSFLLYDENIVRWIYERKIVNLSIKQLSS